MSLVKIGDLFNLEKGSLQSSKNIEGKYNFITAAEEWKTNNEYSHECEALIFAAAASGSLGRTHYVNGKFITSDLCFILTPRDEEEYPIDLNFYQFVFNSLREEIVKKTKTGTSKESINQGNLKSYEIPYFGIEQQHLWIQKLLNTKTLKQELAKEIDNQQNLLTKLRQSILQEAIEGKLTSKWREENQDIEPASILLEKIQVEKEQLVKEKKIKKSKPLAEISAEEIPFDIPDNWEWSRLENCVELIMGQSPSADTYNQVGNGLPFFQGKKEFGYIYPTGNSIWCSEPKRISKCNDILISVRAPVGDVNISDKEYAIGRGLSIIRSLNVSLLDYWYIFYLLMAMQNQWTKKGSFFDAITKDIIENKVIPLPPFEEQKEIVKQIEKIFAVCEELEDQINSSKQNTQTLMQAILNEAFATA